MVPSSNCHSTAVDAENMSPARLAQVANVRIVPMTPRPAIPAPRRDGLQLSQMRPKSRAPLSVRRTDHDMFSRWHVFVTGRSNLQVLTLGEDNLGRRRSATGG